MGIFRYDNPIFRFISKIFDLLLLSIIWLVCCLPIITIGASSCALLYVTMKLVKSWNINILQTFFKGFKDNFKKGTTIWLFLLVFGLILSMDIYFWSNLSGPLFYVFVGVTCILIAVFVVIFLYAFALQAYFENSVRQTIRNAFLIGIINWRSTIPLLLFIALIAYLCVKISIAFIVVPMFLMGVIALILSTHYVRVFARYHAPVPDVEASDSGWHLDDQN